MDDTIKDGYTRKPMYDETPEWDISEPYPTGKDKVAENHFNRVRRNKRNENTR